MYYNKLYIKCMQFKPDLKLCFANNVTFDKKYILIVVMLLSHVIDMFNYSCLVSNYQREKAISIYTKYQFSTIPVFISVDFLVICIFVLPLHE